MQTELNLAFNVLMDDKRRPGGKLAVAALLGASPEFNLVCVGLSIQGLGACTFASVAYLSAADVVYCYPPNETYYKLLSSINPSIINLHETLYTRGSAFQPAYEAIIQEVLQVVRSGKSVAYATQGSPAFHCGTAVSLHRRATKEGFYSILVPGVSSQEILLTELAVDYDLSNLQSYSIPSLLEGKGPLLSSEACLLFDLSRFVLPAIREAARDLSRPNLAIVVAFLQRLYPASHEVLLLFVLTDGSCSRFRTELCDLERAILTFDNVPTLFIPPVTAGSR